MITTITTSKLFVTSSRQKSIMAAMENPINAELVQQLSEYLSEDSKETLKSAISSEQSKRQSSNNSAPSEPEDMGGEPDGFTPSHSPSSPSAGSAPSSGGNVFDDFDFDGANADMPNDGGEGESTVPVDNAPVDESTKVGGRPVTGSTTIEDKITIDTAVIKGTLNAQSDTCGVSRVSIEDDTELWIYYEDEINLNDIMISVIELLNAMGYTYLKFNRLGRSNNAIIFDIKGVDEIKSIQEVSEET